MLLSFLGGCSCHIVCVVSETHSWIRSRNLLVFRCMKGVLGIEAVLEECACNRSFDSEQVNTWEITTIQLNKPQVFEFNHSFVVITWMLVRIKTKYDYIRYV